MKILGARSKGKEHGSPANENGAASGILLSMDMVSTDYYAAVYTVPIQLGSSQHLSLQVDTGSSDLWIASKSCSSASCLAINGRLYDPSSSKSTDATLSMQYLSGTVSGPIVWDRVQFGDYVIPNQALVAATSVNNEPLSHAFDGILGLALPANSLIRQTIPAGTDDAPDGAPISSNLFSLTPAADAPSQPFFSLALARPGFTQIPSLLGIGRHPPEIVSDPSRIRYSALVSDSAGMLFWKTTVRAITVYVAGEAHPISLQSLSGAPEPTALLDSGVPLIITTPALANGIYGALGISPSSDGNYYVPCTTPLNMTITLDDQDEISVHPLDLTAESSGQSNSQYCTGLIQTDPSHLTATSDIGDMILGVPFMRNVYTVMAYEPPDANGNFNNSVQFGTQPMLGLLGVTNATRAMEEFDQVRMVKQPSGKGATPPGGSSYAGGVPQFSIAIKILIGLAGFLGLCIALFALRCLVARRRLRRRRSPKDKVEDGAYQRTRSGSQSTVEESTLVCDGPSPHKDKFSHEDGLPSEFGVRKSKSADTPTESDVWDSWNPYYLAGTCGDTIVGTDAGDKTSLYSSSYFAPPDPDRDSPLASPELTSALLMAHDRSDSQTSDLAEFGMGGMAGIGVAARLARPSYDNFTPLRPVVSSLQTSHAPRESVGAPL